MRKSLTGLYEIAHLPAAIQPAARRLSESESTAMDLGFFSGVCFIRIHLEKAGAPDALVQSVKAEEQRAMDRLIGAPAPDPNGEVEYQSWID
jgi:hypothetical protein